MRTETEIRVVLFDLGNVLVDLGALEDFAKVFNISEGSESELWEMWLKPSAVKAFDSGQIPLPKFFDQSLLETWCKQNPQDFIENFIGWPKGLFDGYRLT